VDGLQLFHLSPEKIVLCIVVIVFRSSVLRDHHVMMPVAIAAVMVAVVIAVIVTIDVIAGKVFSGRSMENS
jgi:hypothetical protein